MQVCSKTILQGRRRLIGVGVGAVRFRLRLRAFCDDLICRCRTAESEHGQYLLQAKELPEGSQILQDGSGPGSEYSQDNEV